MGWDFTILSQQDGAPGLYIWMVWFATTLAECRDCSKLGVRAGEEPRLFLEVDGESQIKIFTRYITGLNYLWDLFSLLDHRLRICAWCPEKPKSSHAGGRALSLGSLFRVCYPLPFPGLHWLLGQTMMKSVPKPFLIILFIVFIFKSVNSCLSAVSPAFWSQ